MSCRIDLRHDQTSSLIESSSVPNVTIYAPSWLNEALDLLTTKLNGLTFQVHDKTSPSSSSSSNSTIIEEFTISTTSSPLTLRTLQMIARCEPVNVSGAISQIHYAPAGLNDETIYAIRDLVRQSIIVALDETTHYGGYFSCQRESQIGPVYIVDLAGLQFQQSHNTGRLVLSKDRLPEGLLDDFIYEKVVGEKRNTFQEIEAEKHQHEAQSRYTKYMYYRSGKMVKAYFDTKAYRRFVTNDVILTGIAVNEVASENGHLLNFKFLKYGTGYFAGELIEHLEPHILPGVLDGLEILFSDYNPKTIKSLEFPFYKVDTESDTRLKILSFKYNIPYRFSTDDALKNTTKSEGLVTAVTNCGDPHAAFGNEMDFGSVDATIAENLKSKGNILCPCLNKRILEKFISIQIN